MLIETYSLQTADCCMKAKDKIENTDMTLEEVQRIIEMAAT